MTFDEFVSHIKESIQPRFNIESVNDLQTEMLDLAPLNIVNKQVLRFYRAISSTGVIHFGKTLLLTGIKSEQIKDVLQWAALCKDLLLDPATSDVYLFIIWCGGVTPSMEECLRIEANEDFCRKFVLRPSEDLESFIDRTFLKKVDVPEPLDLGQDPLISAFSGLEEEFSWLDESEKARWRSAFNSGASGFDLFNMLISNKLEKDEAS